MQGERRSPSNGPARAPGRLQSLCGKRRLQEKRKIRGGRCPRSWREGKVTTGPAGPPVGETISQCILRKPHRIVEMTSRVRRRAGLLVFALCRRPPRALLPPPPPPPAARAHDAQQRPHVTARARGRTARTSGGAWGQEKTATRLGMWAPERSTPVRPSLCRPPPGRRAAQSSAADLISRLISKGREVQPPGREG